MNAPVATNDDLFHLLADNVVDYALFLLDLNGRVVSWNPGAERIKFYKPQEIIGRHFSTFYREEDVLRHIPTMELEIALEEGRFEDEGWRVRKDGSQFWANVVITCLRDQNGNPRGFGKLTRDLTERRNTERLLRLSKLELEQQLDEITAELARLNDALIKSEERFRRIIESGPNPMFMVNDSDEIESVNTRLERLFGYSEAELTGQKSTILLQPDSASEPKSHVFLNKASSVDSRERLTGRRKDGSVFPIEVHLSPIEMDGAELLLAAVFDVSEWSRHEDRLQATLLEKDILLGEIHHRVKNNLQIICSLLELQSDRVDDKSAVNVLRDSVNRVRSMALVHQISYQSRDFTSVEFDLVIQSLVPALLGSYQVDMTRVDVELELATVKLTINAAIPCGLIVSELVSNALKHAFPPTMSGKIKISLSQDEADFVTVSVADTGIGLAEDFDPKKAKTFGMNIVRMLTEQLGGAMQVQSREPTHFALRFPLRR